MKLKLTARISNHRVSGPVMLQVHGRPGSGLARHLRIGLLIAVLSSLVIWAVFLGIVF